MKSSSSTYTYSDSDFNLHGDITQEMRNCAKTRGIPLLTITQSKRGAEENQHQTNSDVGGSIKKVRYSDLVIMIKQNATVDMQDPQVKQDVNLQHNINIISQPNTNINNVTIPFEVSITKNKNGDRDMKKYHVFSKTNLRIHDSFNSYLTYNKECIKKTKHMISSLDTVEFSNSTFSGENTIDII